MTRSSLHGIPVTYLRAPDGASAVIADHGAHVLSWIPVSGDEMLYLSAKSRYGAGSAIRGGAPIIFPQFAERGDGVRHGFARVSNWMLAGTSVQGGWARASYVLENGMLPANAWHNAFSLRFDVSIRAQELQMSLTVHNPSPSAWQFNAALHTYLQVSDIASVQVGGLAGRTFIDQTRAGVMDQQSHSMLAIDGEVDRVYLNTPTSVHLSDPQHKLASSQQGFADTVVWNPGPAKAAALSDMASGDFQRFLCIEAAQVATPIELAAHASWQGVQTIVRES